ncbi:phosphoglycerate dehydrogenase [Geopsychrobacter electrodiphilus]|uniref:phosphoglycerate dehydrogenase n=1 Tax=Geopsychrobacter electrodiphilus TaxID=225196 RepID=UPI000378AEED|nr:phosphoglycerate dehydrogenase [Geopsychrobacter electrodiphilus]
MKILVADRLSQAGLDIFSAAEGVTLDYQPELSEQALLCAVADADALVVRSGTHLTAEVFEKAKCLRVVGRAGIGAENVDLDAANRRGVVVMNTPFGSSITSAEHTIAMLMALARHIPQACAALRAGKWQKDSHLGVELSGKMFGVIGAGKIGRLVIERALGLKMQVLVCDPYLTTEAIQQLGGEQVELLDLLRRADFISLHVPLNQETRGFLNAELLAQTKPGCRIINCAQGGLIDEEALVAALKSGQIVGAALDVFAKEPPSADHPLLQFDQVIATPHLRAASADAQINIAVQIARQILDFLQRDLITNALNVPSVNASLLKKMRPSFELAERMGLFMAQYRSGHFKQVSLEYTGTMTTHPLELLTATFLKGLLRPVLGEQVNDVNASLLARENGIRVSETRVYSAAEFASSIQVRIDSDQESHSLSGALFGEKDYRLVRIDDYMVEAIPEGHLLVVHNEDRPGVIAQVSGILASAGVNISMFNLSRRRIEGTAVALIGVDTPVSPDVLHQIDEAEGVLFVRPIHLPLATDWDSL